MIHMECHATFLQKGVPSATVLNVALGLTPESQLQPTEDNFLFLFFFFFFQRKQVDISHGLSAWKTIHMKCQDLFSLKNEKKKK